MWIGEWPWLLVMVIAFYAAGFVVAGIAIMRARTAQGATAWAIALISFPFVAVPAYMFLGTSRFEGYVRARRADSARLRKILAEARGKDPELRYEPAADKQSLKVLERLAGLAFTRNAGLEIYETGDDAFGAMLAAIASAERYVLVQFYIVRDDGLGRRLRDALAAAARRGVKVHFLFDALGSHRIPRAYVRHLTEAGVEVAAFKSTKTWKGHFQLNFRNHRKMVVVDGQTAFVGGFNVGDEYLGLNEELGDWRDTQLKVEGCAALQAQLSFCEDWFWTTGRAPDLRWQLETDDAATAGVLMLSSGPVEDPEVGALFFHHLFSTARRRVWISTPYFVPDAAIIGALRLAVLRGVDVRILTSGICDNRLCQLASYAFLPMILPHGIKILRYMDGFLHQKAVLVDDELATIGSANVDNRSFRLNFEITAVVHDRAFAGRVERMFERDFAKAREAAPADLEKRGLPFRLTVNFAHLLAPVL